MPVYELKGCQDEPLGDHLSRFWKDGGGDHLDFLRASPCICPTPGPYHSATHGPPASRPMGFCLPNPGTTR